MSLVALVVTGTFVIYGLDRLRDLETDLAAWPERTAFVDRHRRGMWAAVAGAAAIAAGCAVRQPPAVWAICTAVGALGLAHRRMKSPSTFKIAYLTTAWWAIVVGLPLACAETGPPGPRVAGVGLATGGALVANFVVSSSELDTARRSWVARGVSGLGVAAALGAGPALGAIVWVPLAQLLALLPASLGERARLWRIDGALAIGAAVGLAIWGGR